MQWIAHQQLAACRDRAPHAGLPIGLYLDMAVGVRPDGFDAWSDQDVYPAELEIGAPPDVTQHPGAALGTGGLQSRSR